MCPTVKRIEAVENDVAALRQDITTQKDEISTLKNLLKEHQKPLDTLQKQKREKNIIVSGVICDENENLKEKVLKVFEKTEAPTTNGDIIKAYRIGKFDHNADKDDYRQILVEFKTVDMKHNVLRSSKKD